MPCLNICWSSSAEEEEEEEEVRNMESGDKIAVYTRRLIN
jgi:cell division protein FtsB